LRTCRIHCGGKNNLTDHRPNCPGKCDERCKPHKCNPLGASTIRQVHSLLSGALKKAKLWRWLTVNPLEQIEAPKAPEPNPDPPTAEQAARIITEAFVELPWGMFVWLAMTTGARRGELCAIRLDKLDLKNGTVHIVSSIAQKGRRTWEKKTKEKRGKKISLDATTVALLELYLKKCREIATEAGVELDPAGRIFSTSMDHGTWIKPATISQKYDRMCERIGWNMHIHQLRHYSVTELLTAGVDVRTVAGRHGHSNAATTLRFYSAWMPGADQDAADALGARMPTPPIALDGSPASEPREVEPKYPYEQLAADLRGAIRCGALKPGDALPPQKELQERYSHSAGTAQRAFDVLRLERLIIVSRGKRAIVADPKQLAEEPLADVINLDIKRAQ
jgi:integrase/DNA-binding transcriptional regulator YhcF (GntR family)